MEMVAMFLHILAHDMKNRMIQRQFVQSGETVSRHFNLVLLAVLRLHDELLKKPQPVTNSCTDPRWKWFENYLATLDGTYIKVNVSATDRPRYRTRKGEVATNVLDVCDTKGDFVFVLSEWEGSAADSRILRDAISRHKRLKVSKGYYDLCDAGYPNAEEWQVHHEHRNTHGLKRKKQNLLSNWWNWFQLGDEGLIMGHFDLDRAMRARLETFANVGSNVLNMFNDSVPHDDSHDQDIPTMYSQGVHMSPDEMFGIRASQASERRNCSSGSKRKRSSEHYETVEVIRSAIADFGNEMIK
ncbi:putative nuclease HARBI1 [Cucumis melo var. makuwa]|uniref:Nuclease HARBI1 n=1 Tax=Cucumis melo var. makuwa TaxID=1194695 RepID=A0A5A7UAW6_CUCMM|nr:putative nuclease HARBI1 [Cucumis melo var. makuwa]TYK20446.1 putative nuclease HARBI1 [Cucumis melo var. makuwa]